MYQRTREREKDSQALGGYEDVCVEFYSLNAGALMTLSSASNHTSLQLE